MARPRAGWPFGGPMASTQRATHGPRDGVAKPQEHELMASATARDQGEAGAGLPSSPAEHPSQRRSALILAGSLLGGLLAAIALVLGPFAGGGEAVITGAILLGFAVGWALLSVLSVGLTARPQRWAAGPAAGG